MRRSYIFSGPFQDMILTVLSYYYISKNFSPYQTGVFTVA